ncbi:MAG: hypothetical protein HYU67_01180 [Flavobacteriia bacterium]|nr:hypothetical protein [Flavobacteriia bacterium]
MTYCLFHFTFFNAQTLINIEHQKFSSDAFPSLYTDLFSDHSDTLYRNNRENFNVNWSPHLIYAYEDNVFAHQTGFQFNFFATYQNYIDLHLHCKAGLSNANSNAYESVLQSKAYFFQELDTNVNLFQDLRFRWIWRTNKFIQFHFGIDKHKIGEGNRSLFLGNEGIASPFVMLKSSFWKLEYLYIHQILREGKTTHYMPKGNAQHLLQFNWNKNLSLAFFENVGYIIKDTLYDRGLEWEYWNPTIFFRPQEYSLGSSDNVNMGFQMTVRFKKNMFYAQFILDEFLLSQIKARSRWQHNKYGVQFGFKKELNIKNRPLFWRIECNIVRPYTYSHKDFNTSYSNQSLPLAHPLGSNFAEFFNEIFISGKWLNTYFFTQFYLKGNDIVGNKTSYGGDLLKSYSDKPEGQEFGFKIGSGEKTYRLQIGTKFVKTIFNKRWNLFVEPRLILEKRKPTIENKVFVTVGLTSRFLEEWRNY